MVDLDQARSEAPIERIRRRRRRPWQFGMRRLFALTLAAGVVVAVPRIVGIEYGWYFLLLYMIAYALAPSIALASYLALPARIGRLRGTLALSAALLAAVPFLALGAWYEGWNSALRALGLTLLWFWGPQAICIFLVYWFVFRPGSSGSPAS